MEDVTYTKGIYTAIATTRELHSGRYQGVVALTRHDGDELPATTVHEVEAASRSHAEALEEAKALAHRILGRLERW